MTTATLSHPDPCDTCNLPFDLADCEMGPGFVCPARRAWESGRPVGGWVEEEIMGKNAEIRKTCVHVELGEDFPAPVDLQTEMDAASDAWDAAWAAADLEALAENLRLCVIRLSRARFVLAKGAAA